MRYDFKQHIKGNKGTAAVLVAIMMTILIGFAALAVDIGMVAMEKSKLSAALDAAALAGAQEMVKNIDNTEPVVNTYLTKNSDDLQNINVVVNSTSRSVQVSASKKVDFFFARILGRSNMTVSALAAAKIENIKTLKGASPLGIVRQDFIYGSQYTLKEGSGDGTTGNYDAVALGGNGGSTYRDNMITGYNGVISVGDQIETETGNMSGPTIDAVTELIGQCTHYPKCTYESFNVNCSRIIFLPVVDTLTVNGRKYVNIVGFATFFLEGISSSGGQAAVTGRFITYDMQGETSSSINDYGTYGIRLIK